MSSRIAGKQARMTRSIAALALILAPLAGIAEEPVSRWYSAAQVDAGRSVYEQNCAVCHGDDGEGQPGWQERDAMGFYPAPPLDASGHADEHAMDDMMNTLNIGGGPLGGTMPSFSDVLSSAEMEAVIAYFQSLWPDEIYAGWQDVNAGRVLTSQEQHDHH